MKASTNSARPASRAAAFVGGAVAALAAVALAVAIGVGNASAASSDTSTAADQAAAAATTVVCPNDVDADGVCDICGSTAPGDCLGLRNHDGSAAGNGNANGGNVGAVNGNGYCYGNGDGCGGAHHAYRHGC